MTKTNLQVVRDTETIKNLLIEKAMSEEGIRAVLLNGSRANPRIEPDKLQDFDVVYVVNDLRPFLADPSWVDCFGERLIWQLPDTMDLGHGTEKKKPTSFAYLMQFADGNRIDLTLLEKSAMASISRRDSLTVVWLDKDGLFSDIPAPSESDYWIKRPTEKQFSDTCNEFFWVCPYVAKGLVRNELTYAKHMLETVVRPMFLKMIEWYIGTKTDFSVAFGKGGKFAKNHLSDQQYATLLKTYADHQPENNWTALFLMIELFGKFAKSIAHELAFGFNQEEEENVTGYLRKLYLEVN